MKRGILLLVLGLMGCLLPAGCSKSDEADPKPPPKEEPAPEEGEFKDVGWTMEEFMEDEDDSCFYSFFRFQNASDYVVTYHLGFFGAAMMETGEIHPGEQATTWVTMSYLHFPGQPEPTEDEFLALDLYDAVWIIRFFVNYPPPEERPIVVGDPLTPNREIDTLAEYNFLERPITTTGQTPLNQSKWVFERPDTNTVRWTYRITNAEHDEAVRQTMIRWADKKDDKK